MNELTNQELMKVQAEADSTLTSHGNTDYHFGDGHTFRCTPVND